MKEQALLAKIRAKPSQRLQDLWNYESSAPRCSTCVQFQEQRVSRKEGRVVSQKSTCQLGGFVIRATGVCDKWTGINGDILE